MKVPSFFTAHSWMMLAARLYEDDATFDVLVIFGPGVCSEIGTWFFLATAAAVARSGHQIGLLLSPSVDW